VNQPQNMVALQRAQVVRFGIRDILRSVKAAEMSITAALVDPRAKPLTVYRLLMAQYGWGQDRTLRTLGRAGAILFEDGPPLSEVLLVGDLTDRQRQALIRACSPVERGT
jgi:hypothetical protein